MSRRGTDQDFIAGEAFDSEGEEQLIPDDLDDESEAGSDNSMGGAVTGTRTRGKGKQVQQEAGGKRLVRGKKGKGRAWEGEFEHTWDNVQEDERGTLEGAVSGALMGGKTRR